MKHSLVLASGNPGKLAELGALLEPLGIELLAQSTLGVPVPEETAADFAGNALLKARHAHQHTGLSALADDSGLEVDALGGAPGVYSARYAGPEADDQQNNQRLLRELEAVPMTQRTARFRCVIAWLAPPAPVALFEGSWEGCIAERPRGTGGFGYDSLFYLSALGCTSAELPAAQKNRLSHRGQAVAAFLHALHQR